MTPARLADRLERLRPSRFEPAVLLGELADVAREVRMLSVPRSPTVIRYEAPDPLADQRLRRAHALLRAREGEIAQLRRLLASARPRPRRRHEPDTRQLRLPLGRCGERAA